MKFTDLIPGKYYYGICNNKWINIWLSKGDNKYSYSIRIHKNEYTNNWDDSSSYTSNSTSHKWEIREATPDEIYWLNLCIKEDKFVEKHKIEYYELY